MISVLKPEELNDAGEVIAAEIAINWGAFIQAIIDFALIAVVLFATLKIVNVIKGRWDYINKQLHKEEIKKAYFENPHKVFWTSNSS